MATQTPRASVTDESTATYESATPVRRRTFTESKAGFKTTEFFVMLLFVAGVLVATYADEDSISRDDGWLFAALAVAAYIVSRGLAKLGTREPYEEVRNRDR
jgi:hypothetical protein